MIPFLLTSQQPNDLQTPFSLWMCVSTFNNWLSSKRLPSRNASARGMLDSSAEKTLWAQLYALSQVEEEPFMGGGGRRRGMSEWDAHSTAQHFCAGAGILSQQNASRKMNYWFSYKSSRVIFLFCFVFPFKMINVWFYFCEKFYFHLVQVKRNPSKEVSGKKHFPSMMYRGGNSVFWPSWGTKG